MIENEMINLPRRQMLTRLEILRTPSSLNLQLGVFEDIKATIIEVMDQENARFPFKVKNTARKMLWRAKVAHITWGGDYPYLSNPDEFNMHLNIHLSAYVARSVSPPLLSRDHHNSPTKEESKEEELVEIEDEEFE
eukprot:CAMPEP_0201499388 /NCGR_PEP_ID=MMETSP0151_2-20130828/75867_1 /ASSEMBLY_ACC=CAM_ASM_000257 /TAXON_ID=200890 /ORGANISM="Paramoeba atlantica, Strain 621/1 / CCAP 1560/9" /LENGTH=135 /DNA_ID=CAMNT_0047891661 /DNA_START=591 /DNA_END=995 /DNA_ORIENTATION=-